MQVPKERRLVAAVIYNRLSAGDPARDRRDDPLRDRQLHRADHPGGARRPTRPTTPVSTPACRPTPIGNPGLAAIEAAAHPANASTTSTYVVKPDTCGEHAFSASDAEFEAATPRPTRRRSRRRAARRPSAGDGAMKRLAVLGDPVAHSRSPAMQNAALAALGLGGGVELRGDRGAARPTSRRVVRALPGDGFVGANVTVPHKEAALALADDALRGRPRDRRGQHAQLRRRHDPGRRTPTPRGSCAALPAPPDGRRALVLGRRWRRPGGRLGARPPRRRSSTSGTAPSASSCPQPLRRARAETAVDERPNQVGYELIVNSTAVGLRGEDPFEELPLDPDRFGSGQTVVDMVYGAGPSAIDAAAAAAGGDDGRRHRGPRPAGRPLAADLDRRRAAARRDAGGRPQRALGREPALLASGAWGICA